MTQVPGSVLQAWSLQGSTLSEIASGLINQTFLVSNGERRWVLQCLHPIFSAEIHQNIHAVTSHLAKKGLATPQLVPTDGGQLFEAHEQKIWRLMTYVAGENVEQFSGPENARAAGALVAQFHRALVDLDHVFVGVRKGVHDTQHHLQVLDEALDNHQDHRLYKDADALAQKMKSMRENILDFSSLPDRTSHGDLKCSNLMFDSDGQGLCLIDLDTLGPMPWPVELADAFRSWCAPYREDDPNIHFDLDIFEAGLDGYFTSAKNIWTDAEKDALVPAVATICFELSSRFLADALNESYFGYDAERYDSRGAHNLARAKSQWALCSSVLEHQDKLQQLVRQATA